MMNKKSVLVVDDHDHWCQLLTDLLLNEFDVVQAHTRTKALAKLWQQVPSFHVAVIDVRLVDTDPKDESGLDLIALLNLQGEYTSSVAITGAYSTDIVRRAFRDLGICDYFEKDKFDNAKFRDAVRSAAQDAVNERKKLQGALPETFDDRMYFLLKLERSRLRVELSEAFSAAELRGLSFDMGVNFENLRGSDLNSKVVALLEHCYRHDLLGELIRKCCIARPDRKWM